jgi:hypothetical protein
VKSGLERLNVFSHTWKVDPTDKHTHKNNHDHIHTHVEHVCNSGTTQWNLGKEGRKKQMTASVSNIVKYNIYEGRGQACVLKALGKWIRGKEKRKVLNELNVCSQWDTLINPFKHQLKY